MATEGIVIGTGLRNDDGSSRARVIRRRCTIGSEVVVRRAPETREASSAIAVYLRVPRWFGLRSSLAQIGYLDATSAASLMERLDVEGEARLRVKSVYAPEEKDSPRVSLALD